MKILNNITGIILFVIFVPFIFIANKIQDLIESKKEPEPEIRHTKKKTVYPEGWNPNATPKEFNEWAEDIHRLNNN